MPLMEHLRELRSRLTRALLCILLGVIVAWLLYTPILDILTQPIERARPALEEQGISTILNMGGVGGALQFQLQTSLSVGLIIASSRPR